MHTSSDPSPPVTATATDAAPAPAQTAPSAPPPGLSPAACAAALAQHFPALFGPGVAPQPLKLRIQVDIQQRAPGVFTKKALSLFLQRHTTSTAYLKALVAAAQRVDLDGQPAGDIADEHRQAATEELQRRRALHDARRAAERTAQREAQREAHRKAHDAARQAYAADAEARGRREALLRAFETTTLTRRNFCALKGVAEAELDATLAQARQEREQRAQAPRPERRDGPPPRQQPGHRRPAAAGKPRR